ncbi:hypothetical protein FOMPIDRAFT_1018384 [Fomitopsis schrenkii]|uniref:DUF659 domain-containing protein n=1 Tax=Fomitopsis schrenkii TaxID=2126942 RepID=S8E1S9_FOMSC|nr:hypothetical protein FOMPIDRAFT_1018384 [Fomitopsis schrenkii]
MTTGQQRRVGAADRAVGDVEGTEHSGAVNPGDWTSRITGSTHEDRRSDAELDSSEEVIDEDPKTAEDELDLPRNVRGNGEEVVLPNDDGFHELMKTGQLEYKLPSAMTVGHDVCCVFSGTREHIRKMLKEFDGNLDFATDAWTSPNQKALVVFTVHFHHQGSLISLVLDVVELPMVESLGIKEKMLSVTADNATENDTMIDELHKLVESFPGQKM